MSIFDEIKQRVNMFDIIDRCTQYELKRNTMCCPFHSEKTPSFSVLKDGGRYHCFGCNKSGDIFTFISKLNNISIYAAAQYIDSVFSLGVMSDSRLRVSVPQQCPVTFYKWRQTLLENAARKCNRTNELLRRKLTGESRCRVLRLREKYIILIDVLTAADDSTAKQLYAEGFNL